jgi:hypothetical protein
MYHGFKKSASSSLAQILQDLGYQSTKADPNVWLGKATTKDDGFVEYCEMLFVYVDDIIALSHRAKNAIEEITEFYKAKERSVKQTEIYLGANISSDTMAKYSRSYRTDGASRFPSTSTTYSPPNNA